MSAKVLIPLFPLPNVVFFPHTDLQLHIFEPRYRRLVSDLESFPVEEQLVGIVLAEQPAPDRQIVYSPGTAGQLVGVEPLEDGRSNIQLRGVFRFELERELEEERRDTPYRKAIVRPDLDTLTGSVDEIVALAQHLASLSSIGLSKPEIFDLASETPVALVNRLCSELDLATSSRQRLLAAPANERATAVSRILDHRLHTVRLLAPFRGRCSGHPERN